jgi:adenylosuccinate lyase
LSVPIFSLTRRYDAYREPESGRPGGTIGGMWTDRYAHDLTRLTFDPVAVIRQRLRVLSAVAAVTPGASPGLATTIEALDSHRVVRQSLELEREFGHDVAAQLSVIRGMVGDDLVGFGLTSSNIVDTAQVLTLRTSARDLAGLAYEAASVIQAPPNDDPKLRPYQASRTHGQPAEHGELRAHRSVWASRLANAADRAAKWSAPGQLAGPTGRYAVLGYDEATMALRSLGLRMPDDQWPDQALDRRYFLEWGQAIGAIATACAHFATQIRLGATRGEAWEASGVTNYHGSSSMPHKRNPTRSERIVGLERVVRANVGAMAESVVWWDQRDLTASSVERIVLPTIAELTGFILTETRSIADGTTWDDRTLRANGAPIAGPSSAEAMWAGVVGGERLEEVYDRLSGRTRSGPDTHDRDPGIGDPNPAPFPGS